GFPINHTRFRLCYILAGRSFKDTSPLTGSPEGRTTRRSTMVGLHIHVLELLPRYVIPNVDGLATRTVHILGSGAENLHVLFGGNLQSRCTLDTPLTIGVIRYSFHLGPFVGLDRTIIV